jgi:hypothetical protein
VARVKRTTTASTLTLALNSSESSTLDPKGKAENQSGGVTSHYVLELGQTPHNLPTNFCHDAQQGSQLESLCRAFAYIAY